MAHAVSICSPTAGMSEWAGVPKDQWLQWLLLGLVGLGADTAAAFASSPRASDHPAGPREVGLILLLSCVRDLLCPTGGSSPALTSLPLTLSNLGSLLSGGSVPVLTSLSFALGLTGLSLAAAAVYIGWCGGGAAAGV